MKAQTAKNAVIVPTVRKRVCAAADPSSPELREDEALNSTRLHAGTLGHHGQPRRGAVVHPPRVRVHDDDGAYLVVAADKGTAAFSARRMASPGVRVLAGRRLRVGGERGLRPRGARDHRAGRVGVGEAPLPRTRHRRCNAFTVVGIGDMSGDVFGNGMLLSQYSISSPRSTIAMSSSTRTPTRP